MAKSRFHVGVSAPKCVCQESETPCVDYDTCSAKTQPWIIPLALTPRLLSNSLGEKSRSLEHWYHYKFKALNLNCKPQQFYPEILSLVHPLPHCPQQLFHTFTIFLKPVTSAYHLPLSVSHG